LASDDLPKISEVMMEELVNATNVIEAKAEQLEYESDVAHGTPMDREAAPEEEIVVIETEEEVVLAVTADGEIVEGTNDAEDKDAEA